MIDTHAHLTKRLNEGFELPKIKTILAASCMEDSEENIELAREYPEKLFACVGVHPQEKIIDIDKLDDLVSRNKVVAIGECGLEFMNEYDQAIQEQIFVKQIELSIKYNKPLIIHARKAVDETIEILKSYPTIGGVFHCFAGGKKRIKKVIDLGKKWFIGIDGNLTYEIGLEKVVKEVPHDRLMLETDSPFLTPIPYRDEMNKPDYVEYVYRKVAEVWQLDFEEVERRIDTNVENLFELSAF